MKAFKYLFIIMFATAALVGCKKKAAEEAEADTPEVVVDTKFDTIAKETCKCTEGYLGAMDKIAELTEAGKTDDITEISEKMDARMAEMEKCMLALEAKYPEMKEENEANQAKAQAALVKHCPAFAKALEAGE